MSKVFNERLREIIAIRGRTGQDIADAIGMERKTVIRMKNDPSYDPKLSVAVKLADDLGVPLPWLLGRDHEAKVVVLKTKEVVKEIVEVPVEVPVHRKFFNPKWEEGDRG